jgi:hypothetical protein
MAMHTATITPMAAIPMYNRLQEINLTVSI